MTFASVTVPNGMKLFVGNLSFDMTEAELEELFAIKVICANASYLAVPVNRVSNHL